jgi:hypothetical protein
MPLFLLLLVTQVLLLVQLLLLVQVLTLQQHAPRQLEYAM